MPEVLAHHDRIRRVRAAQRHVPEADALDVVRREPVQPRARLRPALRRARVDARVPQPGAHVQRGVGDVALHDPGVHPGRQPRGDPLRPVLARAVQPRREQLADAALGEMVRQPPDHERARAVAAEPGVAVDVVHPRRADHERRVAHDLVEPPPAHRLEPRPLGELDVQLVEAERAPRERQRAGGHVGRGDVPRVRARVQRLHAAPGAEVEQGADRAAGGGAGQVDRRVADAEHVVVGHRAAALVRVEVGDHPPAVPVRPDVQSRAAVRREHLAGDGLVQVHGAQRGTHGGRGLGVAEQEQADQRAERTGVTARAARGLRLATAQRGVGRRAERGEHAVGGVAGGQERLTQACAEAGGEFWGHEATSCHGVRGNNRGRPGLAPDGTIGHPRSKTGPIEDRTEKATRCPDR